MANQTTDLIQHLTAGHLGELLVSLLLGAMALCVCTGVLLGRCMTRRQTVWFVSTVAVAVSSYVFAVAAAVIPMTVWQLVWCALAATIALSANAVHEPDYRTHIDY